MCVSSIIISTFQVISTCCTVNLVMFLRFFSTTRVFKKVIKLEANKMPATSSTVANEQYLNRSLDVADPELYDLIKLEKRRQRYGLELIASENFTSVPVLQCLASCLHNKYSEGLPGQRYYGGTEVIDKVEILAQKRALAAFKLDPNEWGVNVQPYSGSPANFAVYTALVGPHGRIMGLDLPDGGHLTHGFFTPAKKISASSLFFESQPYKVNLETGLIDYDQLSMSSKLFRPRLIIAGISCYSRCLDYKRFRDICDSVGAILFSDMSHVAGLVAANLIPSPFQYSDVVMTTTHKSLRGPRAAMIFYRRGATYDYETKINQAVFPGLQGGPHNHAIAGIATAMLDAQTPEFQQYQGQVVANAQRLAAQLKGRGYRIVTGGTDVHLVLVDMRTHPTLSGSKVEHILEVVGMACNKNTVPGDRSALNPSGIRLGTPALTTRGLGESDMDQVVEFFDCGVQVALLAVQKANGPKLVDFKRVLAEDTDVKGQVELLRRRIEEFSGKFPLPGYEDY